MLNAYYCFVSLLNYLRIQINVKRLGALVITMRSMIYKYSKNIHLHDIDEQTLQSSPGTRDRRGKKPAIAAFIDGIDLFVHWNCLCTREDLQTYLLRISFEN